MKSATRRLVAPFAALVVVGIALSGCASGNGATPNGQIGTADGVVKIEGPIVSGEAALLEKSWAGWEKANHIKIEYTGSANFNESIGGEAQQGNTPDLAIFQQPGLIDDLASRGYIQKLPDAMQKTVAANFPADWANYTSVSGTEYAAPLLATLNSYVWFSPEQFSKLGLAVPTTWQQLLTVTEYLRANTGTPPWCEGFSSDAASGSAGATWIADMVLREDGPAAYDDWVNHKLAFSDPSIQKAFNDAGEILQNHDWVNAGFGTTASINTTSTSQVASALESGTCAMTHQPSSFLGALSTAGATVADIGPQSKLWAFLLPPTDNSTTTPITVGGSFVAAFSNDADTVKVQQYLASTAWAKSRMELGGVLSPNKHIVPESSPQQLVTASMTLLQSPRATIRFNAADLMPSVVGAGTFLTGMVDWLNGTKMPVVLSTIDQSWPSD